jgi:hypothetical protein
MLALVSQHRCMSPVSDDPQVKFPIPIPEQLTPDDVPLTPLSCSAKNIDPDSGTFLDPPTVKWIHVCRD